jgi:RNA polymerase sigma-70 factor, ECF subfamily
VSIWRQAGRFDPEKGSAMTWMASVLRNRCLDMIRARRPEESIEDKPAWLEWPDDAPGPLEAALANADGKALRDCLKGLEAGPRDAILRIYFEGLTHSELAERARIPLGTIKSWVRRGLMRLKRCLER